MQTDRERLIDLLRQQPIGVCGGDIADHLLAHGVTLALPEPPAALIEEAVQVYAEGIRADRREAADWGNNLGNIILWSRPGFAALYRAGLLRAREEGR